MLLLRLFSAEDRGVYVVCSLIGYLLFLALRPALWAPIAALMLTYHLFLAHRVLVSEKKGARSYSLPATIAAHLGFLVVLVGARLAFAAAIVLMLRSEPKQTLAGAAGIAAYIIVIGSVVITYGLVVLECKFLFAGRQQKTSEDPALIEQVLIEMHAKAPQDASTLVAATGSDFDEWTRYCAKRKSAYYDPRKSPAEDFEQWLRARGKTQYSLTQNQSGTVAN